MRLPSAAIKPWNHCALSLATASDPVLTPQGVLYDREAILQNLLHQKKEARVQIGLQNAEQARIAKEHAERFAEQKAHLEKSFVETQELMHQRGKENDDTAAPEEQRTNFWLPSDDKVKTVTTTHEAELRPFKRRKKDKKLLRTVCPVTQSALKAKDLIGLKLARVKKSELANQSGELNEKNNADKDVKDVSEQRPDSLADAMFMCPICQAVLVNASKPIALRTGTVLCAKCVDQFVLKSARDPVTEVEIDLKTDVIRIHNSGTGFAGSTPDDCASKEAKLYRPSAR
ncbi:nitric oxide synthase-interacting protein [Gracilaria domingensis]|nr:nitric oxide synthase-interacting protein [Gracilaria domingensis]